MKQLKRSSMVKDAQQNVRHQDAWQVKEVREC